MSLAFKTLLYIAQIITSSYIPACLLVYFLFLFYFFITQSPWFAKGLTFGVVNFMGVAKCIIIHTHHYVPYRMLSIFCKTETPLCSTCLFLLSPTTVHLLSFPCFHRFTFSRMLYSWNYLVYSLSRLASFSESKLLSFFHVCLWLGNLKSY